MSKKRRKKITKFFAKSRCMNKYEIGDIVHYEDEMGIITKIVDRRYDKQLIKEGRGWYYWVVFNGHAGQLKETEIDLIFSIWSGNFD